ncbi:MAG: hydroxylase [Planctomycetes bacterium]|nr:hydroxylase [Planctomycetota bacterium]
MTIHYLEIVTPDIGAVCATYERVHGLSFGPALPALGQARVAQLPGGGRLGVRSPLSAEEGPIVRAYLRVADVDAAARAAEASGAVIALPSTELAGEGKIAIFIQGGIQHGVWQPPE